MAGIPLAKPRGRLSTQVLQEYYQVVTRRLVPGLPRETARQDIFDLTTWQPQPIDQQVMECAWTIEDRFGLSWWDSLIVGAAQRLGAKRLLTEDLQTDQDFDGLLVVNPFETPPG